MARFETTKLYTNEDETLMVKATVETFTPYSKFGTIKNNFSILETHVFVPLTEQWIELSNDSIYASAERFMTTVLENQIKEIEARREDSHADEYY